MKAGEKSLLKYLDGTDQEFVIPVYQRRYDWHIEQCKKLWDDLERVMKNGFVSHFFGSLVSVITPSPKKTEYLVIDGQQRITTVSLIMAAICNLIDQGEYPDPQGYKNKILNEYLIDPYDNDDDKYRLKLIQQDRGIYNKIIEHDFDDIPKGSTVWVNYEFFVNRLLANKAQYSVEQIFQAIRRLSIVDIQLEQGKDDPQLIFESLNSTGLALSEADKIRNLVLMNLPNKTQTEYYKKYWQKIEENTTIKNDFTKSSVSDFIRDYLTVKLRRIPRADQIYFDFKDYSRDFSEGLEILLQELLKYSKYYKILLSGIYQNKLVQNRLLSLLMLDNRVVFPYLMELLEDREANIISDESLAEVLFHLESFLFRRTICSVPTNALNKLFTTLEKDIRKHNEYSNEYLRVFDHEISRRQASSRFPGDEEFRQALLTRDIYNMQSRTKVYLLEELENIDNEKIVDLTSAIKNHDITIEHIMPQTLSDVWIEELGQNYQTVHEKWLHTLGNLTLTKYNSQYKNHRFIDKRECKNGFKESKLTLNHYLQKCEVWQESQIIERAGILANHAINRWPVIRSTLAETAKEAERYTLADDESYTFLALQSYEFHGLECITHTWSEMYKNIFQKIYDSEPQILKDFMDIPQQGLSSLQINIASDAQKLRAAHALEQSLFIETKLDTNSKLKMLRQLFELYEIDADDLIFNVQRDCGFEVDSNLDFLNQNRDISVEMWTDLLQNSEVFFPENLLMIQEMYQRQALRPSPKEIASLLGLETIGLTAKITSLGKRIIKYTGIKSQFNTDGGQRYWNIAFMGDSEPPTFYWILRPELIESIEKIGIDWIINHAKHEEISEIKKAQLDFWISFVDYAFSKQEFASQFNKRKPRPVHYFDLLVGDPKYQVTLITNTKGKKISAEIYIPTNKALFYRLAANKDEIEAILQTEIMWTDAEQVSRIRCFHPGDILAVNLDKKELFKWLCEMSIKLKNVATMYKE